MSRKKKHNLKGIKQAKKEARTKFTHDTTEQLKDHNAQMDAKEKENENRIEALEANYKKTIKEKDDKIKKLEAGNKKFRQELIKEANDKIKRKVKSLKGKLRSRLAKLDKEIIKTINSKHWWEKKNELLLEKYLEAKQVFAQTRETRKKVHNAHGEFQQCEDLIDRKYAELKKAEKKIELTLKGEE